MKEKIDPELWKAVVESPYSHINYEDLLEHDPTRIRKEEMTLALKEETLLIPDCLSVENIYVPSSSSSEGIRVRIYRPKGKQNLPVLLYFHGGAFIYGTPEQYDFIFFRLAPETDMIIASVDYRLAPEHPFPAGMKDGYDTLLWLSEHADQIGGDKNNILIGGSSAGATIAASVTHLARDTKKAYIRHQYLLYPPMDCLLQTSSMKELANAPMQTKNSAAWMWKHYLQDDFMSPQRYAVPLQENNFSNLPDATIIVCQFDPLKDEGKAYAQKLQEAGVSADLHEIRGAVHAFDFFSASLSEDFYQKQVRLFQQIVNPNT